MSTSKDLIDKFDAFLKDSVASKKPSFEEVFQKTLDITTPTTPGDLRTVKKPKVEDDGDLSEWI